MISPVPHFLVYTGVALFLLMRGGNELCRLVFFFSGLTNVNSPDPVQPVKAGRIVGSLERLVIAMGLAAGSWEVVAAVIALKTVARFKELDEKLFAEYFLIGSLFSLLWASAVTGAWLIYDARLGVKARDQLAAIVEPAEEEMGDTPDRRRQRPAARKVAKARLAG